MKTNMYLDKEMEYMIRFLETKMIVDNQVMDKIRLFYRVKEEYLDIVFETIKKGVLGKSARAIGCGHSPH